MTDCPLIIIAGLSGVGKSYLMKQLLAVNPHCVNFSAGTLLKRGMQAQDRDALRLLGADKVLANQQILAEELNKERKQLNNTHTILLDAHMLIDGDEEEIELPLEVFERFKPACFAILTEDVDTLAKRREADATRSRPVRDVVTLKKQQERSIALARQYAEVMGVPFLHITHRDYSSLVTTIGNNSLSNN